MRGPLGSLTLVSLLAASAATPVFGWGCEGHQMVALIARAHLTPAASAAVDRLLAENPIDPAQKRFCQDRPADPMADGAAWADDMKPLDKTFNWHQIDIPLPFTAPPARKEDAMKFCDPLGPSVGGKDRPGCIVNATAYEWQVLRDLKQPAADRAKALRYIIHFMGDLSQPLHDADNADQGGNCTRIRFLGEEKLRTLHAIWDYEILARELARLNQTQPGYGAGIDKEYAAHWHEWGEAKTDILAWAWEGHDLATSSTYAGLKPAIPVAPAGTPLADRAACDAGRNRVEALHIAVAEEYVAQALPVIRGQLAKAAYRLAGMLNQTF